MDLFLPAICCLSKLYKGWNIALTLFICLDLQFPNPAPWQAPQQTRRGSIGYLLNGTVGDLTAASREVWEPPKVHPSHRTCGGIAKQIP